jgi:restriction modification system DNA specificity domain protein
LFNAAKGGVRMREGWEYKTIEKCTSIEYGTRVVQKRDGGTIYPVYGGGGETFRMDRYNREDCLIIARFAMSPRCVRYVAGKFFLNDSGLSVKSKEELEQAYLNYHLLFFNDVIYHLGKGAAQRNLDVKAFRQLVIAIPPKSTQLSIVSELDKLNELIRIKKEQLKDYDTLAQSIFYEMFGDPVENEKGWKVKQLKDVSTLLNGRAYKQQELLDKGKYKVLRVGNFFTNSTFYYSDLELDDDKYSEYGDLLFAWSASFGAFIWNGDKVIYHYHIWKVLFDKDCLDIQYYRYLLNTMTSFFMNDVHGIGMVHLTKSGMEQYNLPIPPLPLQHSFAQKIEQIEQQKAAIQKTITDLETLLAARMQYWFG